MGRRPYKTLGITKEMLAEAHELTAKYQALVPATSWKDIAACPICGKEPELVSFYIKGVANRLNYRVVCRECGYRLDEPDSLNSPVKALFFWNRNAIALRVWANMLDGSEI